MRLPTVSHLYLAALAAATCAPSLTAQWVSFSNQTGTRMVASATLGASDTQEKDYAFADLDQDGDTDLVCVRKEPFTSSGRFPNVLFMNENGVLTDRSSTLTSSTVPGSSGFLDSTNDRDVVIADVTGDGWLDVITCTTLTAGQPQYIRVPRVYVNRGNDSGGNWLGLLFDDALRIDDSGWGNNGEHRFCAVAAGDVDNDGDMDLYFGDYQQGGGRSMDIDDRLLINDGTGYFTDETSARMTFQMVESSFGMEVAMVDMNMDNKLDIIKDDALNAPQGISVSYNDTATAGVFGTYEIVYGNTPYNFEIDDLNNDNLPDMIVSDDGPDRYILHTGVSGGVATFTPTILFSYTGGGSDDGFGGNNAIADLDNDGWKDAIIADVDVDIAGCGRRCHIYRNLGNAPNVTLQEQIISGEVVGGISTGMLQGTFDVAIFDINGDGWKDMVVGRCTGTQVWMNEPPTGMSFSFVGGLPSLIAPGVARTLTFNASGIGGVTPVAGSGKLFYSINGAAFQSINMTNSGPNQYTVQMPVMPNCADEMQFYVSVDDNNSTTHYDPPTAPAGFYTAIAASGTDVLLEDNFEAGSTGWTVVNDPSLTGGGWEVADPIGTINAGVFAAPNDDAEAGAAVNAFITQNGLNGAPAYASDVDGGPTDLISPVLDYGGTDGSISYQRWFYSNGSDVLEVSVTGDGATWVPVETVTGNNNNQWLSNQFRVSDYITPTSTVQVRFRTFDTPNNSITEAGIDVFRAEAFTCDTCQEVFPAANGRQRRDGNVRWRSVAGHQHDAEDHRHAGADQRLAGVRRVRHADAVRRW